MLFGCVDNVLLVLMAYDNYVAICHHLYYTTIMREGLHAMLLAGSGRLSCGNDLPPSGPGVLLC